MSNLLSQASLVMIPSGYKEDVVYSQIPTDGSGDLSFTRASNGTRVNSAGLVEVVPWNLVEYSEDMNNQPVNVDVTVNITATTSPIGTSNGNKVSETATTNPHLIRTNKATPNGYDIVSIYAKAAERTFIQIQSWADPTSYVNFNLTTGVVSAYSVATIYGIESVGNGWYRCYANVQGSGAGIVGVGIITSGTAGWAQSYLGDTSKGVYMWGLQINTGALKPYFPTTDRLNVPRLTYQNGGGGCPSLLLEKQSTNLANYSQDFGNAYWSKGGATITANATTSPDGTQDADKIAENTTSTTTHYINKGFTLSATTYTLSVFAKASERKWIFLIATTSADVGAFFDLENGVVGNVSSGYSASIENFGNGWYRCNLTFTATAATWYINYLTATANNTYNYAGTIGSGIYVWGAQLEAGSYPTSYIPTTSSSATRVADACSKTGISSLIGQTEGTIFLDAYFDDLDTVNFSISDGTSGNYVLIDSSSGAVVFALVQQGGATQATINTSASFYTVGARLKCAIAYKANDFAFYINGNLIGTDNSGTVPACDQIRFARWNGVNPATQRVNEVITFPTRLTNAELAQLTA